MHYSAIKECTWVHLFNQKFIAYYKWYQSQVVSTADKTHMSQIMEAIVSVKQQQDAQQANQQVQPKVLDKLVQQMHAISTKINLIAKA